MRFLIDAQLPPALCGWFEERGLIAQHVSIALGGQTPDSVIASHVEQHGLILVTKDDDFLLRHPPIRSRLLWLRCGNISNRGLRLWLDARWPMIEERFDQGDLVIEVR
jgi:predicted nuclease of predicted toxin-antitoxin system